MAYLTKNLVFGPFGRHRWSSIPSFGLLDKDPIVLTNQLLMLDLTHQGVMEAILVADVTKNLIFLPLGCPG